MKIRTSYMKEQPLPYMKGDVLLQWGGAPLTTAPSVQARCAYSPYDARSCGHKVLFFHDLQVGDIQRRVVRPDPPICAAEA